MFLSITQFFGHFHPILVHLPIGILLIALLLQWLAGREKYKSFYAPVPFLLLCGMISAIAACISGYLLSLSDDYSNDIVSWHMWMGISVAIVSVVLYLKERKIRLAQQIRFLPAILFVLIMITGHLGGMLTHGSDYLSEPFADIFSDNNTGSVVIKPLPDVQEAVAYRDIVQPILQTRCYSCHGPGKQKGKLRLDDSVSIMKGGEDGKVIAAHQADESEMIKRMLLPIDNDDHMPPREKPQPTESQINLVRWWIGEGADFSKKVKDMSQPESLKPTLLALQEVPELKMTKVIVPTEPVEPAPLAALEKLKEQGIIVLPVAKESNYLLANFVTHSSVTSEDLNLLLPLKKQLTWLKMGFTDLSDDKMAAIKQLPNLTRLSIEHTAVSDKGIAELQSNKKLQYLNIVGTNVTSGGLSHLKELKELRDVYAYRTKIVASECKELISALPEIKIETGNYEVPTLSSDTVVVKVASSN
ncbi:MAG: hypothetical protein JNK79_10115 [Chitinophagaceae bacterium]|nr:hypothetical protein [Chitinophagaceae bacterium]